MNFPGTELSIKDQRKKNGGNERALVTEHINKKKASYHKYEPGHVEYLLEAGLHFDP